MAFHNHHHHHLQNNHQITTTTTTPCCCHPPNPPPPPPQQQPPLTTADPCLIATIVSQLLQTSPHKNYPHHQTHPSHFQHPNSPFSSLIQRIDALESSLQRLSSSSTCFSLRDAAARTIQAHFRAFLVGRSRTLRQLKELASIKSSLTSLNSSLSRHGFVDFDFVSRKATNLLLQLDSIQSGDQLIRDSKRSITREIVQFLEMVDGVCVKRHHVLTKTMKNWRLVRNDSRSMAHDGRGSSERGLGTKSRNVDSNEKKLIGNLRERIERIGRMSRALKNEEIDDLETEGIEHLDDEDDIIDQIANKYCVQSGGSLKKSSLGSNAKKRVCFVEDGNVVRVYDIDKDSRSTSRDTDEIEDTSKGREDEEQAQSDGERSSQSGEEEKNRLFREDGHRNQDEEFTFCAPEPLKMEARTALMRRNQM